MIQKIKSLLSNTILVIKKYPFTLLFSFLAMFFYILAIEVYEYSDGFFHSLSDYPIVKLGLISSLGISLFFSIAMVNQAKKIFWLPFLGIALLAFYYYIFPSFPEDWTENDVTIFVIISILHHLGVAFLPFVFNKENELDFWSYNKSLFANMAKTIVFVGVLTGGLLLAIAAVENLFNVYINDRVYFYMSIYASVFGSCFVFLLFANEGLLGLKTDSEVPLVQKVFVQYILIPLLFIYGLILYTYSFKILLQWSLPKGWVTYMVVAYSFVGIISLLLIYPLSKQTEKVWVRWFDRIFYFSLLPLLVLLFVAIFTRILAYGITPNRYFVLLIAIFITVVSFYFILYKKATIKFIPISLFILAFTSIAIPYMNAFSTSIRSQKQQFIEILNKNNLLDNGKINFDAEIKSDVANRISDVVVFLMQNKQATFIDEYLHNTKVDSIFENNNYYSEWEFKNNFTNITYNDESERKVSNFTLNSLGNDKLINVSDFDFYINLNDYESNQTFALKDNLTLKIKKNLNKEGRKYFLFDIENEHNEVLSSYDMANFIDSLYQNHVKNNTQYYKDVSNIEHTFELQNKTFVVNFESIQFSFAGNESMIQPLIENLRVYARGYILIRESKG